MQTLNRGIAIKAVTGLLFLTVVTSCAEWNSVPVVVDENFGHAFNNMVKNQTLYPEHGQNDNPIMTLDGQKAQGVINAYRMPTEEKLEQSKKGAKFDVQSIGSGSN